jgi:hypothetical protein
LLRRLIFEDVEVAAGNEDGVGELVALAERAELVPGVNDAKDVVVVGVVESVEVVEAVEMGAR